MNSVDNDSARHSAADGRQDFLQALTPQLPRLLPLLAALLLVTEAILALVVIFSRMSAFQQFVCVVLIVVLPAAALGFGLALLARLTAQHARQPEIELARPKNRYRALEKSPWNPAVIDAHAKSTIDLVSEVIPEDPPRQITAADSASAANELAIIVEQLEEMSVRARRLPFNTIALNDNDFTYVLVKLRAALQNLRPSRSDVPKQQGFMADDDPVLPMDAIERIQDEMRTKKRTSRRETVALPNPEPVPVEPEPPGVESVAEAREALRRGDAESAIRGLKELLGRDGEDAEAAELLGIAYERAGELESALEAMRVAVLTDPKRASSHYNYAVLLAKADRLLDAYRQNEVALRLNPQYTAARDYQKGLQSRITAEQTGGIHAIVGGADSLSRS